MPLQTLVNFDKIYGNVQRGANGFAGGGTIQFPVEDTLALLVQHRIYKEDLLANLLGAYSIAEKVTGGTAYWASLDTMRYVTTTRPSDCDRTALTDGTITSASKAMSKAHVFLKFCKDTWTAQFDAKWKSLWGAGNDLNEINATEEGRQHFLAYTNNVVEAIGSDFSQIGWFGNLAIITSTLSTNPLGLSDAVKARIEDTFAVADGWLKQIDALKTVSYPHINNTFDSGDMDGYKFIGDAIGLISNLKEKAQPDFAEALSQLKESMMHPIVFVTTGIFNKLKADITALNPSNVSMLQYQMDGTLAEEMGIQLRNKVTYNAFVWDGCLIVHRPDWEATARKIGFWHHRALMIVPGALGLAIDVEEMSAYNGMGLAITKSGDPKDGGAYFLETNYQIATAVLKNTHIVNYSYTAVVS